MWCTVYLRPESHYKINKDRERKRERATERESEREREREKDTHTHTQGRGLSPGSSFSRPALFGGQFLCPIVVTGTMNLKADSRLGASRHAE